MQSSATFRVLALLGASWAYYAGTAPPNPPASDTEQENYSDENKDTLKAVLPITVALRIVRVRSHCFYTFCIAH